MKQALALLINDLHIDKDNIADFLDNWHEAISICQQNGIADIVVGGDFFTSRSSQTLATLLAVKHALDMAVAKGIYITIAEGNHDKVNQEEIEGYCHLFQGLNGVEIVDTYKALYWDDCDFCLLVMSYFPEEGSFLNKLEQAVQDTIVKLHPDITGEHQMLLYIHEGVHGALGDFDIPGELPQEPLLNFKAVLCGHYHNRCKIKGTQIEYIGSSRQNNFGEDEEKGYTILYDDGTTKFVKNQVNQRYTTVEVNADNLAELDDYFADDAMSNYKVRIKVHCSEQQAKVFDKQKLLEMGFNKVEIQTGKEKPKEVAASGIDEKYDKQGIKKEYQSFCAEKEIDAELGIQYLEKIN